MNARDNNFNPLAGEIEVMKPEFHYTRGDYTASFDVICGTPAAAEAVRDVLPHLCGVALKRDGDTLHFTIGIDRLDEAILTIESVGYATLDLVARDEDYAIQEYEAGLDAEEAEEGD